MGVGLLLDIAKNGTGLLLSTIMERLQGVLLPDPLGACALLPKVLDQLRELESLASIHGQDFPGSTMLFSPSQRCNWMMEIKQLRPIGQIVWPGTHNSATNNIGIKLITRPFRQHQTLSVYHQLRNGVRALDIRVQQDGLVCNGCLLSYSIDLVIVDVKRFLAETQYEIIILEIRTERGCKDPPNFERYLVAELGDLLIQQDDHVFFKTISQVLPRRIICIWKPNYSRRPKAGGPLWSSNYLKDDTFETEMPLTKFEGNLNNLSEQSPASERNFFYRVENTLTPQTSSVLDWLLLWPRHAEEVSKRINGFARLFLANCNTQGVLDRLQIFSVDFVDNDFIIACIGLNHARDIQGSRPVVEMRNSTNSSSSDSSSKNNSTFKVFARDLFITWIENNSYWNWSYLTETPSNIVVEVAELLEVCRLHVFGSFDTEKLHQGFKYEVAFVVMLKNSAKGWESPVNLLLILPDGSTQLNQESLNLKPKEQWIEIPAGNFTMSPSMIGDIKFSLEERGNEWKEGLLIKGVVIQKKYKVENVFARDLSISLYENSQSWRWASLFERGEVLEIAELLKVRCLEVRGKFEIATLLPGYTYDVAYVVMLKDSANGWEGPVNLSLLLPNGNRQEREESLKEKPREEWITISVGEFKKSREMVGNIEFSLYNDDELWKRGLIIKSVVIQQKY